LRKRIIVRIDDVGYTQINNIGAFEVFDNGIGTSADIMLDTPGTEDALERLGNYPWLSIGWHTHFWGSPILGIKEVPLLIDPENGHFRSDLKQISDNNLLYGELYIEMKAQIDRCIRILGRAPDTAEVMEPETTVFARVKRQICKEYRIATDFACRVQPNMEGNASQSTVDKRWKSCNIYWMDPGPAYQALCTDSIEAMGAYDPVKYYTEDHGRMCDYPKEYICGQAWHPGYVDYYMCRCGDRGPNARKFLECRPLDTHALCSKEIKTWIKENQIELINFTDALYGRQDFQNHLRNIGSELCILDQFESKII